MKRKITNKGEEMRVSLKAVVIILSFIVSSLIVFDSTLIGHQKVSGVETIKSKYFSGKNNEHLLLLFFNPSTSSHRSTLFYAQALKQTFSKSGLEIIGISKPVFEDDKLEELVKRSKIDFPVVQDIQSELHQKYKVAQCCGAIVYISKNKIKHRFEKILSPDDLRQLVEKEITGKIDYQLEPVQQNVFFMHQTSPNIDLFKLQNKEKTDLYKLIRRNEKEKI